VFSTVVSVGFWTPRYALLALEAAVGVPVLLALLRSGARRPAAAALCFAGWAALCFAVSPDRTTAFWGAFPWGTGALFVLALVGSWAVGVSAGRWASGWIERGLLVGAGVNAVVAVLQMAFDLSAFELWRFDERSPGLWGNPVFLGAFLLGAVWIALPRLVQRPGAWGAYTVLLGTGLQVSGSRFALVALGATVVGAVRLFGLRPTSVLAACLAAGLLFGAGLAQARGGVSVATRAGHAEATSGVRPRLESWMSARHALAERPLVGHGPGRYRSATSRFRTLRLAQAEGPDRLYADAHNLVAEYSVTTGLPGVVLLLTWLALAIKRAGWRAPLAGFALLVMAMHLVQPQNVGLTPLALLALGAASPLSSAPKPIMPPGVRALVAGTGAVTTGVLLVGAWHLEEARLEASPRRALREASHARRLLPTWAEPRNQTARIYAFHGKTRRDPELLAAARRWKQRALEADPQDPALWNELAEAELNARMVDEAQRHFRRALELNPWSVRAMNGLGRVSLARADHADAQRLFRRSLLADPDQPAIERLLRAP
jgi:hypothetical protein